MGEPSLQQVLSIWSALDMRRRVIVILATLAMFAAVLGLTRMAAQPSMSLLYAGLEPGAAGDVISALEAQGVAYDVRAGAIFVDDVARDALRMTLAADGLPANNGQGYELLDQLSGFGTTAQMFDAAYWRAKEGELARTISASSRIRSTRVHISNPSANPFQRNTRTTASVTVTTVSGALPPEQAKALKFLVSSAVAGMAPEDVSVIDSRVGLVMPDETALGLGGKDRAAELRHNVQRMLEARVGYGNAVVEVNVERVTEREAIVERTFDPDSRVTISSETEERTTNARGTQGDAVTVASNLPAGDAAGGENNSSSENTESRERLNFEVSETTREVLRTPGTVKRISVAVLVDGLRTTDATGSVTWTARPEEELDALRDLVASAIGFDKARGDVITLKSMEFLPTDTDDVPVDSAGLSMLGLNPMTLIQLGVLALVSLVLGLFVVRPIFSAGARAPAAALPGPDRMAQGELPVAESRLQGRTETGAQALTGEIDDGTSPLPRMAVVSADQRNSSEQLPAQVETPMDPVERLRNLIDERRDETVEILRSWMEETEENA